MRPNSIFFTTFFIFFAHLLTAQDCTICPADPGLPAGGGISILSVTDPAGTSIGCIYTGNTFVDCAPIAPLPVELTEFQAQLKQERVSLNWTTASEENNAFFDIQRSVDGVNFEVIGRMEGHGTTNLENFYEFTDPNPQNGFSYYRLHQVDFSGESAFSDIRMVEFRKGKFELTVYQTQGEAELVFDVEEPTQSLIQVFNLNGQLVFSENRWIDQGIQHLNVSLPGNAIYILQVYYDNKVISQKLVGEMY